MGVASLKSGSDIAQWQDFFRDFTRLAQSGAMSSDKCSSLSPNAVSTFFSAFTSIYGSDCVQGRMVDVWEAAGIGTDELRNSAILAWLLDCHGSHGQGASFLREFLACLPGWDRREIAADYHTRVESSYDEGEPDAPQKRSRVDIEVDGPSFLLLLEIKIHAGETNNQLERYCRIGESRKGNRPWALVFVTPDGRPPADTALYAQVYCLSWQTVGCAIARHAATMPQDSHGTIAIKQFCAHMARL